MTDVRQITKSKIICTLGPASDSPEMIERLSGLGMDCARINFSHGTDEYKKNLFEQIRKAVPGLAILCDIQGPKIRIGRVREGGAVLRSGDEITVTTEDIEGAENRISVMYDRLPSEVARGDLIYINDGIVCLRVLEVQGSEIKCVVRSGGFISSRKGVNLPSTDISLKVPTEKDVHDLRLIADLDPEFVAVSFVGDAVDVQGVRDLLSECGNDHIKLISKIERPVAVENFERILRVSDGIMVARGDLGVEIPAEEVLPVQKEMIRKCNIAGKPVVVATQMLESMVKAPVPTRAEVSDVFNAIEDGADAVMLSAETASGNFPVGAVSFMEKIIARSEKDIPYRDPDESDSDEETISEIIGHLVYSACKEFTDMGYAGGKIVCLTHSGHTARMIAKYRPRRPILGVTPDLRCSREMRLLWGLEPIYLEGLDQRVKAIDRIEEAVKVCVGSGYVGEGEKIIIAGNIFNLPARTNMVSIVKAGDLL